MATIDIETKRAMSRAIRLLEVFRSLDPDMPMGAAVSFLIIATGETADTGLSVTELSKQADIPLSTASKYMQYLGQMDRHHRPGQELISDHIDPMERRRKILKVTPKGRKIVHQIATTVGA